MTDTPWEPPMAGTEVEHLLGALDRLRWTFRWKADGLDSAGLRVRVGTSSLTLGGLLKHLAVMEEYQVTVKLSGAPMGSPWDSFGWDGSDDWDFRSAADDSPAELYALYDGSVERARTLLDAALAEGAYDLAEADHTEVDDRADAIAAANERIRAYNSRVCGIDVGVTGADAP